ncbi:YgcG family protein [Apibacter sp. HY039]|uniref:TPM domain-containing protein n=1 Tax=Apibacter sp. HY039 TaxID=2501476 RepID=UPI000FEB78CB|nr:TPM domain-containing protein [Apibacter sp. HY039]
MMPFFKNLVFYFFILFSVFSCKSSQEDLIKRIPDPKTLNETYVSDPDNILDPSTVNSLNSRLRELDLSGKAHIDVVLTNSIGDQVPKDIAYKLFNTWKIGREDTNNGLLIFLVLDQRRVEFETGLGLESVLTDMICGSIQRKYMIPYLKQENYDQAILAAVSQIIEVLDTENYNFDVDDIYKNYSEYYLEDSPEADNQYNYDQKETLIKLPKRHSYSFSDFISNHVSFLSLFITALLVIIIIFNSLKDNESCLNSLVALSGILLSLFTLYMLILYVISASHNLVDLIYFFLIFYLIISILFHIKYIIMFFKIPEQSRYDKYCYLDKYKRGLKKCIYYFPVSFMYFLYIKVCHDMKKYRYEPYRCDKCHKPMVLEKERNLSEGELLEEELKSVEHDVWLCNSCNLEIIIKYPNIHSKVKECKKCHLITAVFENKMVVKHASTSSSGWGYEIYICKFCHAENRKKYIIPKISDSSTSSGSYSGGGRSSSSSSSSSGGRSGGGGAGSSW